jgi:hypothetical protein
MTTPAGEADDLMIAGAVDHPLELTQRDGPLGPLLHLAGPTEGADHATVRSRDGQFRASIPLSVLREGKLVAGRLRLPDPPTRCWDVKDVVRIEVTVGPRPDSVPPGSRPGSVLPGSRPGSVPPGSRPS